MNIYLIKKNGVFYPAYDSDFETAKQIKEGEAKRYDSKKVRNLKHHKKFFALLNLIVENHDRINNIDQCLIEMKLRCGWYDLHVTLKGNSVYIPRSMSFENMGQEKFAEIYSCAVDETCSYFLQGTTSKQIENEIINFM